LNPGQADAFAAVVELEALWDNVPIPGAGASPAEALCGLVAKQRAFDAYRVGLVEYNRDYGAAYRAERPASTPKRLAAWCRRLAAVFQRAERAGCPVQVLEKAHRCAARLALRSAASPCPRAAAPRGPDGAAAELVSIADWCDRLDAAPAPP
jgi:hypothetical protein